MDRINQRKRHAQALASDAARLRACRFKAILNVTSTLAYTSNEELLWLRHRERTLCAPLKGGQNQETARPTQFYWVNSQSTIHRSAVVPLSTHSFSRERTQNPPGHGKVDTQHSASPDNARTPTIRSCTHGACSESLVFSEQEVVFPTSRY